MKIRSNCESAAFYRCGQLELKKANKKLKSLTSVQQRLNVRQYVLNCMSYFIVYLLKYSLDFFNLSDFVPPSYFIGPQCSAVSCSKVSKATFGSLGNDQHLRLVSTNSAIKFLTCSRIRFEVLILLN